MNFFLLIIIVYLKKNKLLMDLIFIHIAVFEKKNTEKFYMHDTN